MVTVNDQVSNENNKRPLEDDVAPPAVIENDGIFLEPFFGDCFFIYSQCLLIRRR